jgi:hypothetical protein
MASPRNDLDEPVTAISTAIEKARQLNMHTSASILVEVADRESRLDGV